MLIRQTIAYLPAQLLGPLTQFATAIVLTHYLGAADYGFTMLIFASQELVFLVCMSWWTFYMLRYAGTFSGEEERIRYAHTEQHVLVITTLLQGIVTAGIVLAAKPDAPLAFHLSACAFTMTRSYLNFLAEYARKNAAIGAYSLVQIVPPVGGLALTVLALETLPAEPSTVLLIYAGMQLAAGLIAGRMVGLRPLGGSMDRPILRAALQFGLPITLAGGFGWIAAHGIRFVVQLGDGAVALGLLSVGWTLATRLSNVAAMLVTAAAYPLAVRAMEAGDEDGARRQISSNSALLLGIIAPATLGVAAINAPLVQLLIAPEYQEITIQILPWALFGAAIRNLRMHGWDQMFLLFEAPKAMLVLEFSEAVATVLATVIGLATGGLAGAVIGAALAAVVIAFFDMLYLRWRFRMPVPLWQLTRVMFASGVMYAAITVLPKFGVTIRPEWGAILLAVLFGMVIYGLLIPILFPALIGSVRQFIAERRAR